ncbi:hypothetical protein BDV96DRAFT_505827 [Lophiotrema nucula]|uniref:BTB domain-containing protein n=1 Tax=Lophiotrema nucula TaxID=690887 RepID=A0A6A5YKU9_9PLEO|nr:hypothetical protein BDV96DRAFT_505827 [Lophiotrema nucula]
MATNRKYDEYLASMRSLLETGKHSDFTITCGNSTFRVHKSIVCTQSEFFDAASRFGKEGQEQLVNLPKDDETAVGYMIQYMYGLDYDIPGSTDDLKGRIMVHWGTGAGTQHGECTKCAEYNSRQKRDLDDYLSNIHQRSDEEAEEFNRMNNRVLVLKPCDPHYAKTLHQIADGFERKRKAGALPTTQAPKFHHDILTHVRVYIMAEKYIIQGLKDTAMEKIKKIILFAHLTNPIWEALELIFKETPHNEGKLRWLAAQRIEQELISYGMYTKLQEFLWSTPDLAVRVLHLKYPRDDRAS